LLSSFQGSPIVKAQSFSDHKLLTNAITVYPRDVRRQRGRYCREEKMGNGFTGLGRDPVSLRFAFN